MTDITYGTLRRFMKGGYDSNPPEEIDGYVLDKDLSHQTANVYYNSDKNEAIINHRGSQGMFDWLYNASYLYGGENFYKLTPRYYEAQKAQEQTEKKYGSGNTITVGHSAGGLLSELLGRNSKQIITLNKATRPQMFPKTKHNNQLDIRSKCDIVSAAGYYDKQIECSSADALAEHKTDVLDRIGDKMVGTGKINFSQDSIMNLNFSHLTPNALANMKHQLNHGHPIDDSRFIPERPRTIRGRGLVAESGIMKGMGRMNGMGRNPAEPLVKNPQPHHSVRIPEMGMMGRGLVAEVEGEGLSGKGLVAEGSGMCGSGMCNKCGCEMKCMKGCGIHTGTGYHADMAGTGKHTEMAGTGKHTEMAGTGKKPMKGSAEMKAKMRKLREMRKAKK